MRKTEVGQLPVAFKNAIVRFFAIGAEAGEQNAAGESGGIRWGKNDEKASQFRRGNDEAEVTLFGWHVRCGFNRNDSVIVGGGPPSVILNKNTSRFGIF